MNRLIDAIQKPGPRDPDCDRSDPNVGVFHAPSVSSDWLPFLCLCNCFDPSLIDRIMKPGQRDLDFDLGDPHVVSIRQRLICGP